MILLLAQVLQAPFAKSNSVKRFNEIIPIALLFNLKNK